MRGIRILILLQLKHELRNKSMRKCRTLQIDLIRVVYNVNLVDNFKIDNAQIFFLYIIYVSAYIEKKESLNKLYDD